MREKNLSLDFYIFWTMMSHKSELNSPGLKSDILISMLQQFWKNRRTFIEFQILCLVDIVYIKNSYFDY